MTSPPLGPVYLHQEQNLEQKRYANIDWGCLVNLARWFALSYADGFKLPFLWGIRCKGAWSLAARVAKVFKKSTYLSWIYGFNLCYPALLSLVDWWAMSYLDG